jgi:uncharacterized protein YigA (DUF484 family)
MKRIAVLGLMLVALYANASTETDQLKAEISQREQVIAQLKQDGKPTGRLEMTVFRLKRDLERQEQMEEMLKTVDR